LALASGKVYRTVNGGVNWSFVNTVTGLESDIFFLDYNTGWIIKIGAEGQGITKTTNAGSNWFVQRDPVSGGGGSGPICIFSLSESKAWIGCGFSTILSLVNDSTWGIQPAPFQSGGFFSINMVNSNIGYSGGLMFIKTTDGGGPITGITHESVSEINGLELYQNFPNPFNSGTSIKFSIDQRSDVRIDIYDVRGIAVSRIADGEYNEGSYDIRFDASGLASGIYYCVITARTQKESFAKSITMVLTK
jgi:hypothetical protein